MLEFSQQCCDANLYLELATACAQGSCYNELRPMGTQLWFALPLWLGLPQEASIVGHFLLLILSTHLAAKVVHQHGLIINCARNTIVFSLVWLVVLAAHLWVFWPVLNVALADAPAGLMVLIGLWSLLLSASRGGWQRRAYLVAAGLALGLAVFARAFYLYPVLLFLAIYLGLQWRRRAIDVTSCLLLVALLPIAIQYAATWQHTGRIGFIDPQMSQKFSGLHFKHAGIGYDTALPGRAVSHFSRCQTQRGGLIEIVMTLSISELACTIGSRLAFYAASDMRSTYIADEGYFNVSLYPEDLNLVGPWPRHNLHIVANDSVAPNGQKTAERLIVSMHESDEPAELNAVVINHQPAMYSASIWLWAEKNTTVVLRWMTFWGGKVQQQREVVVSREPTRYTSSFLMPEGIFYFGLQLVDAKEGQSVNAWGAQIEQADNASGYSDITSPAVARNWSITLAAINAVLLLLAINLLRYSRYRSSEIITSYCFFGLLLAQAILLVPEQRFVLVPQLVIAVFGVLGAIDGVRTIINICYLKGSSQNPMPYVTKL